MFKDLDGMEEHSLPIIGIYERLAQFYQTQNQPEKAMELFAFSVYLLNAFEGQKKQDESAWKLFDIFQKPVPLKKRIVSIVSTMGDLAVEMKKIDCAEVLYEVNRETCY